METGARRTVLDVRVLVETVGTTDGEHDRAVRWAAERVKSATMHVRGGYVATKVRTTDGVSLGMSGYGQRPSEETREILDEIFEEPETA